MPISIRAHSIPHFHHPLLCACVCRTVGLIRPPHLHEGQADSTAARPRKQTGAEQNVGTPFLPMQPDPLHRGERCSEDWGTPPPSLWQTHITQTQTHTVSLCIRWLPQSADPSERAHLAFYCTRIKALTHFHLLSGQDSALKDADWSFCIQPRSPCLAVTHSTRSSVHAQTSAARTIMWPTCWKGIRRAPMLT